MGFQQEISEAFRFARARVLGGKEQCCRENPQIICCKIGSLYCISAQVTGEPEIGGKTGFFEVRLKSSGSNHCRYTWELPDDYPTSCLLSQQAQLEPGFNVLCCKSHRQHQSHDERQMLSL